MVKFDTSFNIPDVSFSYFNIRMLIGVDQWKIPKDKYYCTQLDVAIKQHTCTTNIVRSRD